VCVGVGGAARQETEMESSGGFGYNKASANPCPAIGHMHSSSQRTTLVWDMRRKITIMQTDLMIIVRR